jgi:hypothetical protein
MVIAGGEIQGEEKEQELTRVLMRHVSRVGTAGKRDPDEDPRRRRRDQRR